MTARGPDGTVPDMTQTELAEYWQHETAEGPVGSVTNETAWEELTLGTLE